MSIPEMQRGHYFKLTRCSDGIPIYIKSDAVEAVYSEREHTVVCTPSDCWRVRETVESVLLLVGGYLLLDIDEIVEGGINEKHEN